MKKCGFIFLFALICSHLAAQEIQLIKLKEISFAERTGLWHQGDYSLFLPLDYLTNFYNRYAEQYDQAATSNTFADSSSGEVFYRSNAQRFLLIARTLASAPNGFDLRRWEVDELKSERSEHGQQVYGIGHFLSQWVEQGIVHVQYKGKQLKQLKKQIRYYGEGLDFAYHVSIFAEDSNNILIHYDQHLGW